MKESLNFVQKNLSVATLLHRWHLIVLTVQTVEWIMLANTQPRWEKLLSRIVIFCIMRHILGKGANVSPDKVNIHHWCTKWPGCMSAMDVPPDSRSTGATSLHLLLQIF